MGKPDFYEQRWAPSSRERLFVLGAAAAFLVCAGMLAALLWGKLVWIGPICRFLLAWALGILLVRLSPVVLQAIRMRGRKWLMRADDGGIYVDSSMGWRISWEDICLLRRLEIEPEWRRGPVQFWAFNFAHLPAGPLVPLQSAPEKGKCRWYVVKMYKFGQRPIKLSRLIYPGYYHMRVEEKGVLGFERAVAKFGGRKMLGRPIKTAAEYEKYVV